MEHDPLGCCGNAVVTLIEGREACQNGVVIVGHFGGLCPAVLSWLLKW